MGLELEEPEEFEAITGKGVRAKVKGREVLAGNRKLLAENGFSISNVEEILRKLEGEGKTAVIVAINGRVAGIIGIADTIKEGAKEAIEELHSQEKGEIVIFVGDGINDAPALAQANVGIAVGNATDVAMESGDMVLVRNDPRDVVKAIKLSQKTLAKIKQNIFWAMFYNTVLIPFAAGLAFVLFGITFQPEWAAGAMSLSSVSVVTNSLLLKRVRV